MPSLSRPAKPGLPGSCGALEEDSCPAWEQASALEPQLAGGSDSLKPACMLCGCQGNEIIEVITFANSHVDIQHVSLTVIGQPEARML